MASLKAELARLVSLLHLVCRSRPGSGLKSLWRRGDTEERRNL